MTADVVVVAAGRSRRMGGQDKLWSPVGGRPLLAWTTAALRRSDRVGRIVLVVAPERLASTADADWVREAGAMTAAGGERRQESVAAGIRALEADDGAAVANPDALLLVHDGARPLVTPDLVASVIEATDRNGAAIPALAVGETVKRIEGEVVVGTVDRTTLATAQTPQGVRRGLLQAAYARFDPTGSETWTDEAALLEACTIPVHVVPGDPGNLKVTVPSDLARVAAVVGAGGSVRSGIGVDAHPFGPGEGLMLGGLRFDAWPRLEGHSDGDVVLHAVADALLGAAGLGDLGRLFPAGPATPAGIASTDLLAEVVRRVRERGWRIASVDLTVTAARPRLAQDLERMAGSIAGILDVGPATVNVKASTGNRIGEEGAGRVISAIAVATLDRGQ